METTGTSFWDWTDEDMRKYELGLWETRQLWFDLTGDWR